MTDLQTYRHLSLAIRVLEKRRMEYWNRIVRDNDPETAFSMLEGTYHATRDETQTPVGASS
jgi:hypothetical protein